MWHPWLLTFLSCVAQAEAGPVPGRGSDEHGEWVVEEGARAATDPALPRPTPP